MFKIEDAWPLSQPLWTSKLRSKTALITDFYEQRRLSTSSKASAFCLNLRTGKNKFSDNFL